MNAINHLGGQNAHLKKPYCLLGRAKTMYKVTMLQICSWKDAQQIWCVCKTIWWAQDLIQVLKKKKNRGRNPYRVLHPRRKILT